MRSKLKRWGATLGAVAMAAAHLAGAEEGPVIRSVTAPVDAMAGTTIEVRVMAVNPSGREVQVEVPERMTAQLGTGEKRVEVELKAKEPASGAGRVTAGGFVVRSYEVTLPMGIAGGLNALEVPGWGRAAVDVLPAAETREGAKEKVAGEGAPTTRRPPTNLGRAAPAVAEWKRTFADRLAPHEPIYFVYGPDAPAAKFQVSFKYKLLDFRDLGPQRLMRSLQLAYTQRSIWDLDGTSSPFYDTSYMPELIYEALTPRPEDSERWFTWLGVQAAYKHESNGRDGPVSRSLNVLYARPVFAFGHLDGWHLLVMPEVFAYVGTLEDNPELEDYRGNGKLSLVLGRNDGPSLMATWWAGHEFRHGTVQLDLTVPIRTRLLDFETYLLVQYFNGFGESLLSYDRETETVRAGISLVR